MRVVRRGGTDTALTCSNAAVEGLAFQRCPQLAEQLGAHLAPTRELVVSIPAPRCDHRKHQDPAVAEQSSISARIVRAYLFGHMGDVELDRPPAACLTPGFLEFDSMINIRPGLGNRTRSVEDTAIRAATAELVDRVLVG